jgi:CBS domain-containing protein
MDEELITITPADKIDDCMELMSTKKIRHLPVIDNQIVVGIISMGDVVKAIIEIQKTTIEHLDSYITINKWFIIKLINSCFCGYFYI